MKMRNHNAIAFALIGLLAAIWPERVQAQQATATQGKHCLWKIEGKTNAVYLFGSIHFLKKEFYPLAKPVEEAYKQSEVVVFEADLDDAQSPQGMLKMLAQSTFNDGTTLKDHVSKETYDKVQSYVGETVGPALDLMRPWMVAMSILAMELQKLGFDPEQGVDRYFFNKAKEDKKEIIGLETLEFQLGLFTGLTKEDEDAMLKETLQEISSFKKELIQMTTAWKNGDTQTLDKLMLDAMRDYPQIHKKLLLDRNKVWADKLEKLRAGGKTLFVVVGGGHLVGKDSVVDLLTKKGLKIQQL